MDELIDAGWLRWSRAPAIPFGLGVAFLLVSAWLFWRQALISAVRREHPSGVVIEVSVSKEARRELASVFLSRDSSWSYMLLVRESSISLQAGLPPRSEVFVEARCLRALEYTTKSTPSGTGAGQIILEWSEGVTRRRLEMAPIGWGLRGLSAPPEALTLADIQRGRNLIGLVAIAE
ncbi:hypothetical protein [Microbacterium sp. BK668]|uniref:hypothetical protein n=1 Tax=Microbacterium sp. BK668 TaxID=2512118 RepID=UPI0010614DDF|nr:hypothetical protein [Microbacterium sp. BK668]